MSLRRLLSVGVAVAALTVPNLAAAAERVDPRDSGRIPGTSNPCPSWAPSVRDEWDNLHLGSLNRSRCHIDYLRTLSGAPLLEDNGQQWTDVGLTVRELGRLYDARAGRQQAWIDGSTMFTAGSSLAYIANSGAGATTLSYLGGATLLPVLVSQFNAHEPTRDLYHASSLGMSLIAARYEGLRAIRTKLAFHENHSVARAIVGNAETACVGAIGAAQDVQGRVKEGPERTALLVELKALGSACSNYLADLRALRAYRLDLEMTLVDAPQLYASDVINLDALVLQADRQLRATPLKTLTAIAASPFSSASTLLTGEDGQAAIATLKAQEVFGELKGTLSPINFGSVPKMTLAATPVSIDSLFAIDAAAAKLIGKGQGDAYQHSAIALRAAARELNAARPLLAKQFDLLATADVLVASTQLDFTCDVSTRKVRVSLDKPKPPPTIVAK
jgi:hypothetical protein